MIKYATLKKLDVTNGPGLGASIFTQGCSFHCPGCFNFEIWDHSGGKLLTPEKQAEFFDVLKGEIGIVRLSILGGEPLEQAEDILEFIKTAKKELPGISVWLWTGFYMDELGEVQKKCISECSYVVDGRWEKSKADRTLRFRGSSNQTIWKNESGTWVKSKYNDERLR